MESLVTWFTSTLGDHISREAVVFIISLFPILELRGGILAASLLDVEMWKGIIISAIGNFLPIPFILFFIKKIFAVLKKTRLFRPLVEKLENKAMKKRGQVEKYEFWGLVLFVGIPLPGTGGMDRISDCSVDRYGSEKDNKSRSAGDLYRSGNYDFDILWNYRKYSELKVKGQR